MGISESGRVSGFMLMQKLKGFRGRICEWRLQMGLWVVEKIK